MPSHNDDKIKELDADIQKLNEWVEEQAAQIHALVHVIRALIVTHPDRKLLVETIKQDLPVQDAVLNGSSLPDESISAFQEVIEGMLRLADGR